MLHICRACECDGDHRSAHIKSVSFPFRPRKGQGRNSIRQMADVACSMCACHLPIAIRDALRIPRRTQPPRRQALRNARSNSQARPGRRGCVTCPDHRRSGSPYLLLAVFDINYIRFRVSAPREGLAKAATSIVRFSRGRRAQRDQEPMWLGSSRSRVGRCGETSRRRARTALLYT